MRLGLRGSAVILLALVAGAGRAVAVDTPEAHHTAGMEHARAGRAPEAIAEFRAALRLDHDYLPSLLQMADVLSSSDRVFEAYGVLQHAVEVAPASAEAHALRGRCLSRLERWNDTREELRRAIALNPELTEPYYGLAVVEAHQGRLAEARRHAETFLQRSPDDDAARELLARVCLEMKDYEGALAAYRALEKAHPESRTFPRDIGRALMAAGQYQEAEKTYQALALKEPGDPDALRGVYDASYKRGAYPQAVAALESLARLEPKSCEPLLLLARSYHRLGRFEEARQRATRCLGLEPGHSGAHFLIGWTWLGEGDLPKAQAEFGEALKSDPRSVEALFWSATVERRLGNRPGALRLLEKAVSVDPDYTSARYELAQAYSAEGQPDKAAKQFEEFRRLKSREAWTPASGGPGDATHLGDWISFANYLLGEKKPREALVILESARQVAPESAEVLRLTAAARTEVGQVDEALKAYSEAEKRGPTGRLYWGRGVLYRRLGQDPLALADLQRGLALDLSPRESAEAHIVVAAILGERRRYPEAEGALRRALALDPGSLPARVLLVEALARSGKAAEAAQEAHRALADHPQEAGAHLSVARAAVELKQFDEAAAQIGRAAQTAGETTDVGMARARLASAQGRVDEAIDILAKAAQSDPSRGEVFGLLGKLYMGGGRLSEAAVTFEKATIVDPTDAGSWLSLGDIYLGAKRAPAAVRYFEKAVGAAPDDPEGHYQLALALAQAGRTDEAVEAARNAKAHGHPGADSLLQALAPAKPGT